jgi:hypothetical protein
MTVLVEPFTSVYDDRTRLGVILARGRSGFEAYAADDPSLGVSEPAQSRCRDHHDAPVAGPRRKIRLPSRKGPEVTKGGTSCGPLFVQSQRLHWLFG